MPEESHPGSVGDSRTPRCGVRPGPWLSAARTTSLAALAPSVAPSHLWSLFFSSRPSRCQPHPLAPAPHSPGSGRSLCPEQAGRPTSLTYSSTSLCRNAAVLYLPVKILLHTCHLLLVFPDCFGWKGLSRPCSPVSSPSGPPCS